jgi:hypothetical protein
MTLEGLSVSMITDKSFSTSLDIQTLSLLEAQPISQMTLGARVDIQLSSTSNLAYGSVDVDVSIRSLSVDLKATTIPLLIQVTKPTCPPHPSSRTVSHHFGARSPRDCPAVEVQAS